MSFEKIKTLTVEVYSLTVKLYALQFHRYSRSLLIPGHSFVNTMLDLNQQRQDYRSCALPY